MPGALADRLLLSRRQRLREFALKLLASITPTLLIAAVIVALGGRPAAIAVLVFGGLTALALATNLQTVRGATVAGLLIALAQVLWLLFFAYVRSS